MANKQKTVKTLSRRFRVTKTKKVIKRYCGQGHFNSRDTGNITRKKRSNVTMSSTLTKEIMARTNSL